jgi:hypothetical protein
MSSPADADAVGLTIPVLVAAWHFRDQPVEGPGIGREIFLTNDNYSRVELPAYIKTSFPYPVYATIDKRSIGAASEPVYEVVFTPPDVQHISKAEHPTGYYNISIQVAVEITSGFVALKVLGSMAEAFASRLGERFADTVAEAVKRVWLFRRNHEALAIDTTNGMTTIELPDVLTDDARLALIELDVMADEIRGKTLYWDADTKAWRVHAQVVRIEVEPGPGQQSASDRSRKGKSD